MINDCKLGMYVDAGGFGGAAFVTRCACTNCTEREAKVMAEVNAKRKALLALDQAMADLHIGTNVAFQIPVQAEHYIGLIIAADEAWQAARRFILPEERPA